MFRTQDARDIHRRLPRESGGPGWFASVASEADPRVRRNNARVPLPGHLRRDARLSSSPASRLRAWCAAALVLLLAFSLPTRVDANATNAFVTEPEYRALLLELGQRDQALRTGLASCSHVAATDRPQCFQRMRETDVENAAALHGLLWSRGWPLASRVGEDAAFNAFLVIQHAHSGVQAAALPAVAVSVWQGELRPSALALLTDRVLTRAGRPQLYGTQTMRWPLWPGAVRLPVFEPEKLNERRRKLGLSPLH